MFYELCHIGNSDYFVKQYGENFSFAPHMHRCFEFITTLEGEMTVTVDGKEYLLRKDEALLIFPNQIHSLDCTNSKHMLCIFSPQLVAAYSSKVAMKKPENNKFSPKPHLLSELDGFDESTKTIAKKGVLYLICSDFDSKAKYIDRTVKSQNLLEKIFMYIDENFKSECSLSDLSKSLGYDYAYASRYFKRSVGISFNEYVNIYRLNNACYLMNNTDETVLNCALESGYASLRSFNRNFKMHFGISPSEYKKS